MVEANGCTQEIAGMSLPALPPHFLEFAEANAGRKVPPVEKWNPAYCGEIDMRIAADGRWFYQGGPINRLPLVKLFASILLPFVVAAGIAYFLDPPTSRLQRLGVPRWLASPP